MVSRERRRSAPARPLDIGNVVPALCGEIGVWKMITYCPICGSEQGVLHGDQVYVSQWCQECIDAYERGEFEKKKPVDYEIKQGGTQ